MLMNLSKEKMVDLLFLQVRNIWRVDGLYFLGIEEEFNTEAAVEVDSKCWKIMGKIEARHLRKVFNIEEVSPQTFIYLLKNTSWALDIHEKESAVREAEAIFKVTSCRTQKRRVEKGLDVFPCKSVRFAYLQNFAHELDPSVKVECRVCPPDKRPSGVWCEWRFTFKR